MSVRHKRSATNGAWTTSENTLKTVEHVAWVLGIEQPPGILVKEFL
jgi:hypothetical protein